MTKKSPPFRWLDNPILWFLLSIFISPLIAGLILLALPSQMKQPQQVVVVGRDSFMPDEVVCGVPCRYRFDGGIDAMMPGGVVQFSNIDQFIDAVPAARGKAETLRNKAMTNMHYPSMHNGYRYRTNVDGSIDAIAPDGSPKKFDTWQAFWSEASPRG